MKLSAQPMNNREFPYGAESYDAIVAGGGITGVAAALTLAQSGMSVVIAEPTGTLGREIVRARNQFVRLPHYSGVSSSIDEFFHCLQQRKGWFNGEIDPSAAALAFDDLIEKHHIQVLFNVWPSHVSVEDRKVNGAVIATKTGYSCIQASRVIDASAHGKIARKWFGCDVNSNGKSVVHLLFNGVRGETAAKRVISLEGLGELLVICRPTYWKEEVRVSLMISKAVTRSEWMHYLPVLLPVLQQQFPSLNSGGMSFVSEEVWQTPGLQIHTQSQDDRIIGCIEAPDGKPFEIRHSLLGDPQIIHGFTMCGTWLKGFPFDPALEEISIINAFRLGDLAVQSLLNA